MKKVIVTVPPRPDFGNAYWAIGRKFESGTSVVEVDDAQLKELREQPVIGVTDMEDIKAADAASQLPAADLKPDSPASPGKPLNMSKK